MRFLLLMLATAAVLSACEKDPALSNTTNQLAPAKARPVDGANAAVPSGAVPVNAATDSLPSSALGTKAELAPAASGSGVPRGAVSSGSASVPATPTAPASAPLARSPMPVANDEGNGEPMDDVDDELVPATDKSGVDNAEAEEGPTGPLEEDPEGADIDLRE
jgi:hypothetical protein